MIPARSPPPQLPQDTQRRPSLPRSTLEPGITNAAATSSSSSPGATHHTCHMGPLNSARCNQHHSSSQASLSFASPHHHTASSSAPSSVPDSPSTSNPPSSHHTGAPLSTKPWPAKTAGGSMTPLASPPLKLGSKTSFKSLRSQSSKSSIKSPETTSSSSSSTTSLNFMHKLAHLHSKSGSYSPRSPATSLKHTPELLAAASSSPSSSSSSSSSASLAVNSPPQTAHHGRTPSGGSLVSTTSTTFSSTRPPHHSKSSSYNNTPLSLRSPPPPAPSFPSSDSLHSHNKQPKPSASSSPVLDLPPKLESPVPKKPAHPSTLQHHLHHQHPLASVSSPQSSSSSSAAISSYSQVRSPSSTRAPLNDLQRPSSTSSSASASSVPPSPTSSVKETNYVVIDVNPISGRKLLNKYEIIKELGRGQHGKVKLALDTESNELVAIKIVDRLGKPKLGRIRPGLSHEDKVRREIAIMKKCHHPNIVNLLEVLDDSSTKIYLVLEYLERGEVHWQDADGNAAMTQDQARDVARDVISGLEYLHFQGIIHRDIKPANLLRDKNDTVKISDFGVSYASNLDGDTNDEFELAKTAGTPAFFAPELCATSSPDGGPRPPITSMIDIWAVGVTLFCLIYGQLPFCAENEFELFDVIANDPLVFPDEVPVFPVPKKKRNYHSIFYNANPTDDEEANVEDSAPIDDNSVQTPTKNKDNETNNSAEDAAGTKSPTVTPDPKLASVKDLICQILEKDPTKRIDLNGIKHHPWMMEGMDLPHLEHFLTETAPEQLIVVTNEDVQRAVSGIGSRIKRGISRGLSRLGSSALHFTGIRRKGSSSSSSVSRLSEAPSRSVSRDTSASIASTGATAPQRSPSSSTIAVKSPKPDSSGSRNSRSDVKARNKQYFEPSTLLSSTSSGHDSDYSTTSSRFTSRKSTGSSIATNTNIPIVTTTGPAMGTNANTSAVNDGSLPLLDQAILSSRRSTNSSYSSLSSMSSMQSGSHPLSWQMSNPREYYGQPHTHSRDSKSRGTSAIVSRTNSNTNGSDTVNATTVALTPSAGRLSPTMQSPITPVTVGASSSDKRTPKLSTPSFSPFRSSQLLSSGESDIDSNDGLAKSPPSFKSGSGVYAAGKLTASQRNLRLHSVLTGGSSSTGSESDNGAIIERRTKTKSQGTPLKTKPKAEIFSYDSYGDYGGYYGESYNDGYDYDDGLGSGYDSYNAKSLRSNSGVPISSSGLATPIAGLSISDNPLGATLATSSASGSSTIGSNRSRSVSSNLRRSRPVVLDSDIDSGFGDDEEGFGDDPRSFDLDERRFSDVSTTQVSPNLDPLNTSNNIAGFTSLSSLSTVPENPKINALTPAHIRKVSLNTTHDTCSTPTTPASATHTSLASSAASVNSTSSSSSDEEGGGGLTLVVERKPGSSTSSPGPNTSLANTPRGPGSSAVGKQSLSINSSTLPPLPSPTYGTRTISRLVSAPPQNNSNGSIAATPTSAKFIIPPSKLVPPPHLAMASSPGSPFHFEMAGRAGSTSSSTGSQRSNSSASSEILPLPSDLASQMMGAASPMVGGGGGPLSPGFAYDDMEHIVTHHTYRLPPGQQPQAAAPVAPAAVPLAYSGFGYALRPAQSHDSTASESSSNNSSPNSSTGSLVITVPRRSVPSSQAGSGMTTPGVGGAAGSNAVVGGMGTERGRGAGPGAGSHVRSKSVSVAEVQYHRQLVDAYNYGTRNNNSVFACDDSDDDSDSGEETQQELELEFKKRPVRTPEASAKEK